MNIKNLKIWLVAAMFCVAFMVFIGGVTRLTESGLSITQWKLLSGTFPPLSENAWQQEFLEYQTSPEYKQVNSDMQVADFKQIYWLEYIHRLMGRLTGLVIIIPFIFFALSKKLAPISIKRAVCFCVLVAAQGLVGWLMVKSGLVDVPRVSSLRLAIHLLMAFLLFQLLLWSYLDLRALEGSKHTVEDNSLPSKPIKLCAIKFITILVILQIIFGAFVAAIDAGKSYNSFPLMDGDLIPQGLMQLAPFYDNFINNIILVQFQHRILAVLLYILVAIFWIKYKHYSKHANYLFLTINLQFVLGIATLIYVVPVALASMHQMVALLVLSICTAIIHTIVNCNKSSN